MIFCGTSGNGPSSVLGFRRYDIDNIEDGNPKEQLNGDTVDI